MLALDETRKQDAKVSTIVLGPLAPAYVTSMVADTLNCAPERAAPLGNLIYERTGGNPFFAIQFLTALQDERLLQFDVRAAGGSG